MGRDLPLDLKIVSLALSMKFFFFSRRLFLCVSRIQAPPLNSSGGSCYTRFSAEVIPISFCFHEGP